MADSRNHAAYLIALGLLAGMAAGCSDQLIPTPVVYHDRHIDLDVLTDDDKQRTTVDVFYVTDRVAQGPMDDRRYTNGRTDMLKLGEATVRFGDDRLTWEQLSEASHEAKRSRSISIRLENARELGELDPADPGQDRTRPFADAVEQALRGSRNRDVIIYVHGFKVDFAHACKVAAELHHFLARQGAIIAYAWPSRQSLALYGGDVKRAKQSVPQLVALVEMLGRETSVNRIHLIAYSAGAPLVSSALKQLREAHADLDPPQLGEKLKIGRVVFAASDIDTRLFATEDLPAYHDLPDHVLVTLSKGDSALGLSRMMHAGSSRLGSADIGELSEEELEVLRTYDNLDAIDVNYTDGRRSYVVGDDHGYWYLNPLVCSDILASLRFDAKPERRGLKRIPGRQIYYFPVDYRERIIAVLTPAYERIKARQGAD